MSEREKLGTIWEVSDELWERIEPVILEEDPPKARGRKRADAREMLNGIIFRLRSGCQWNQLPKELGDVKGGEIMYHLGGRALRCGV